jgi:hypothetical protein
VATTRLIQFWWRNLDKSNPVDKILYGAAAPPTSTPTSAGSWLDRLSGAARKPQPKPTGNLARRGSVMNLMSSLFDGGLIDRIVALQKRHVCTPPHPPTPPHLLTHTAPPNSRFRACRTHIRPSHAIAHAETPPALGSGRGYGPTSQASGHAQPPSLPLASTVCPHTRPARPARLACPTRHGPARKLMIRPAPQEELRHDFYHALAEYGRFQVGPSWPRPPGPGRPLCRPLPGGPRPGQAE